MGGVVVELIGGPQDGMVLAVPEPLPGTLRFAQCAPLNLARDELPGDLGPLTVHQYRLDLTYPSREIGYVYDGWVLQDHPI